MRSRRLRPLATSVPSSEPDDLLARAGRGDEAAFGALYDHLASLVHGVVLKVVRDPSMAAEVTQEVFVEIWRIAPRFDSTKGSVRGWAATIAHRKAVDRVRSEQARRNREEADHRRSATSQTEVVDDVARILDRERVHHALDELTPVQYEAVTLAYFGGHTYREVASLLDLAEGTVKTRIRDGLIKLRDKIGPNQ